MNAQTAKDPLSQDVAFNSGYTESTVSREDVFLQKKDVIADQ